MLVGSEEIEPGTGWPYAAILRDLTARPSMTPAELATTIVRRYAASYRWPGHGVTQSAIDLVALDELVDAVDRLARVLLAALPGVRLAVVRRPSPDAQLLRRPLRRPASLRVQPGRGERPGRRAARVRERDGDHPGQEGQSPIIAEAHGGPRMAAARGLSIYFPPSGDPSAFYRELDFAQRTRWADFLEVYLRDDPGGARDDGRVVWVVDGDTIHVRIGSRLEKVRYIGANAPRSRIRARGWREGGALAHAANLQLVARDDGLARAGFLHPRHPRAPAGLRLGAARAARGSWRTPR